jgi:hypothetical protein
MSKSHTHLFLALALMAAGTAPAMAAWDDPPGAAWQDRGIHEDHGAAPVLTPRGYRHQPTPIGAYAFTPQTPRQAVKSTSEFERNWFRQAEGPEWN